MLLCAAGSGKARAQAVTDAPIDLTSLPIEQLLQLEVYSASRFAQKTMDAPAAVTVITSADIKTFGYRTLADILRSVRGLHVSYDRNYSYLGARGFSRSGDYNSRILLLLDGVRLQDNVYDSALLGSEFNIDLDLIDRVEYVPGPGSSIYGGNAFFGVINIISKNGKAINGTEASVEAGSNEAKKARLTYGKRLDGGADVVLSVSQYDTPGGSPYFAVFDQPENNHGIARHTDYDRYSHLFGKVSYGGAAVETTYASRTKGLPTGAYGTVFNDPGNHTTDEMLTVDTRLNRSLNSTNDINTRLVYGEYRYQGAYVYLTDVDNAKAVNRDLSQSRWWGGEFRLLNTSLDHHKIVSGIEFQNDVQKDQLNYTENPRTVFLDDRRHGNRRGIFLQDEYRIRSNLLFNAGVRYDRYSTFGGTTNPRLALVYKPDDSKALKLLYGTAFRPPNAYEQFYDSRDIGQKGNPDIQPEKIRSHEIVWEQTIRDSLRLSVDAFYYRINNLIGLTVDPADGLQQFRNLDSATAKGIEFEAEHFWKNGIRVRTSYTLQQTRDAATGEILHNSPRNLLKLNASSPVLDNACVLGLDAQYTGRRRTFTSATGGYPVFNLTLSGRRPVYGFDVSASFYNLLGKIGADPASADNRIDAVQQDGRQFRVKLNYRF